MCLSKPRGVPAWLCCSKTARQEVAGWSCAALCDTRGCFSSALKKQEQLPCPPPSQEGLGSFRTTTDGEKIPNRVCFSLQCSVLLCYTGREGLKLCRRGVCCLLAAELLSPFPQQSRVHAVGAEWTSGAPCSWEAAIHEAFEQCWPWLQGEIGLSVGPAASLTSNDAVPVLWLHLQ